MDPVLSLIANKPDSAVDPSASPPEGTPSPTSAQPPVSGETAPPAAAAPPPAVPVQPPTAAPAQVPAPAQPQISEEAYRAALQKADYADRLTNELVQANQEMQRRQALQQEQQQLAQVRSQIIEQAKTMAPEDAIRFMDHQNALLLDAQRQQRERQLAEVQQRNYQTIVQATAPQYARHLAQTNNLGPEYEQRLSMLAPHDMDRYLPVIVQEAKAAAVQKANYDALVQQLEQVQRSTQANALAASGAHNVGGANGSATNPGGTQAEKGSMDHLLDIFARNNFGIG